ncbi:methylated-DNA--[protein]-cysteine S-methyltransferase [Blastococcus sp. MG754426]|uniref:methylated-DNA--[protein]-cysteine S-methyltransferase n=1 Tax=unclassified Blastococcus TaxID=2619396 RepID=UPI001EEF9751|nr:MULTISPECIES: methylated-DNA--[protein]-cysteine S-methyltransferase [unclassified Blastococcus]MCF6509211.1 methylated-DNA--[protein]-cysteine S-methyltransferase [Blastococcus sp. MG754426]MCF6513779.1 methylated-DNA--[protein]-cysteine S-methyltransferase [Blastococcus sp. MG754427]
MTASARHATVATPPGPFTVVVGTDPDGRDVVLASGWTADVADLLAVVHPALRPEHSEASPRLAVLDAVEEFHAGRVGAIDGVTVRQRSGPFLQEAWDVLRTVPAGRPDTYAAFAARCGRPAAVRAAANACARNAAALFVPCHRVLGSGGGLGGFRWGTPVKRWLLDHEAAHAGAAVGSRVRGAVR